MSDPFVHAATSAFAGTALHTAFDIGAQVLEHRLLPNRGRATPVVDLTGLTGRIAFYGAVGLAVDLDHVWVLLQKGIAVNYRNLSTLADNPFHEPAVLMALAAFCLAALSYSLMFVRGETGASRFYMSLSAGILAALFTHVYVFDNVIHCIWGICRLTLHGP